MATLSLRIQDDLKTKAQRLASEQGVSLNDFVIATIAAAVAQQQTLVSFSHRLPAVDQEAFHKRVLSMRRKTDDSQQCQRHLVT